MDALWLLVVCAGYPKKLRNLTNVGRVLGHKEDLARLQVVDAIDPFLHGVLLTGEVRLWRIRCLRLGQLLLKLHSHTWTCQMFMLRRWQARRGQVSLQLETFKSEVETQPNLN